MANTHPNYTAAEYADMILIYGECHQNAALAIRTYRERYGDSRQCPTNPRTIVGALQRIRENRPVDPRSQRPDRPPTRQNPIQLTENVLQYFEDQPKTSLRQSARHFQVHHRTVHRIIKREKWHPFKFIKVHTLLERDKLIRLNYCQWLLNKIEEDSDFLSQICWTDESTFTRNGMWNQHNLHHWAPKNQNPRVWRESAHQYRFSVNVWAAIHGDNIIGPVFIDGGLTGERFVNLLNDTVSEYTNNLNVHRYQRMWYQLDGAPAHSVITARQWLNNTFGEQWIGRFGPRRWPARSPDLTPLDFFLWGCIKNDVYAENVDSVEQLRHRIINAFEKLREMALSDNLFSNVRENMKRRLALCIRQQGGLIENKKI